MKSENVCRTCLSSFADLIPLYSDFDLTNKLMECASIQVDITDTLPSTICVKCVKRLNEAYEFRELARHSDTLLKTNNHSTEYDITETNPSSSTSFHLSTYDFCDVLIKNEDVKPEINNDQDLDCHLSAASEKSDWSDNVTILQLIKKKKSKQKNKSLKANKTTKLKIKKEKQIEKEQNKKLDKSKSKEEIKRICSTCGKIFTNSSNFHKHFVSHSTEKKHICETCGKKFKLKTYLNRHLREHLEADRRYPCKICGFIFKQRALLHRHLKSHAGIKNYKCSFCEKGFVQKRYLDKHIRVHTGEQPFKCEYCDRAFSAKWNLQQHTRLHTNVKPYKCSQCDCAFRHNVTLKLHIKSKHFIVAE